MNPPGRPIVSANEHPTEKISEFVDLHIKQHVPKIKSYIKDTNHFLQICRSVQLPEGATIMTLDVKGLYTNIPQEEGLIAIEIFMEKYSNATNAKMIKKLTRLILENNVIEFNGQLYLQLMGVAMGSKFAPNYANIFMNHFEEKYLPQAPVTPFLWKRYIDDVFCIFTCSDNEIDAFLKWINSIHQHIKFTSQRDCSGIPFLDTFVQIKDNKIITRLYTKPTDKKQYISPQSCHPPHIHKSVPYSQALRIIRICSNKEDLMKELTNLKGYFKNRGYGDALIDGCFAKALNQPPKKDNVPSNETILTPTVLVLPYHPTLPDYNKIINSTWNIFEPSLKDKMLKPIIAYKRPSNLKNLLTKSRYGPPAIALDTTTNCKSANVINRPLSTYDKNQMLAPVKHIMMKCPDHHIIVDKFKNLQDASISTE
jgi:peptide-methionine (R)-S-oxide reductase